MSFSSCSGAVLYCQVHLILYPIQQEEGSRAAIIQSLVAFRTCSFRDISLLPLHFLTLFLHVTTRGTASSIVPPVNSGFQGSPPEVVPLAAWYPQILPRACQKMLTRKEARWQSRKPLPLSLSNTLCVSLSLSFSFPSSSSLSPSLPSSPSLPPFSPPSPYPSLPPPMNPEPTSTHGHTKITPSYRATI